MKKGDLGSHASDDNALNLFRVITVTFSRNAELTLENIFQQPSLRYYMLTRFKAGFLHQVSRYHLPQCNAYAVAAA